MLSTCSRYGKVNSDFQRVYRSRNGEKKTSVLTRRSIKDKKKQSEPSWLLLLFWIDFYRVNKNGGFT